ncbi:hypothetical protein V8F06_014919, partial [Rhypophila decipiens]
MGSLKKGLKKLLGRRGATSPAPSATKSTGTLRRAPDYLLETCPTDGPTTPSDTTTKPCTPSSPSADHDQAPRPNIDTRATDHQQPAATLQTPLPAPSVEPQAELKTIESTEQPSQRLWDAAYDSLAENKDTAELVRSYMETLEKVLGDKTCELSAVEISASLKDPSQRQAHMRKLIEEGQAKLSTSSKIRQGVGDVVQFVLSAKGMIDLAIQNIPQAALPWAGVCIGLRILLNPIQAIESNLAGITHVISRMDWYCALSKHILSKDNIVVGKESFKSVQLKLEDRLHTKSLLGKLVEEAEKRKALLGDIYQETNQAVQDGNTLRKEIHKDDKDTQCLQDLHLTDP